MAWHGQSHRIGGAGSGDGPGRLWAPDLPGDLGVGARLLPRESRCNTRQTRRWNAVARTSRVSSLSTGWPAAAARSADVAASRPARSLRTSAAGNSSRSRCSSTAGSSPSATRQRPRSVAATSIDAEPRRERREANPLAAAARSIRPRRHPQHAGGLVVDAAGRPEAGRVNGVGDRAMLELVFQTRGAASLRVLGRRHAQQPLERPLQVPGRDAGHASQPGQRGTQVGMRLDPDARALDLLLGDRSARARIAPAAGAEAGALGRIRRRKVRRRGPPGAAGSGTTGGNRCRCW